ncbi:MAG: NAD(P)/FAD-dependent oxidoreductase, partial [Burkholderiales bacterium]
VTSVEFNDAGVAVSAKRQDGSEAQWQARFLVDASGRDTFLANRFGTKRKNPKHNSSAIFGHFTGAKRLPGKAEGNITMFWFDHGWFWFIPLKGDLTSVGAVCWPYYMKSRSTDPTTFFLDTIKLCPALAGRLEQAKLTNRATATGNYSYCAQRMAGDRYLMVGDAYAFIDPVFSSGVMLAMSGAFMAADAIDIYLKDPAAAAPMLQHFERSVRHGIRSFSWFIYRMTNPSMRELFMNPRNYLRMQEALISLLAGDLFRGTPIYGSLRAFKAVYYLTSLCSPLRSCRAWIRRKRAIRDQGDAMIGSKA